MTTYRKCDDEATEIIASMMEKFHSAKHDVGVTVDCLFAYPAQDKNGDSKGPALTLGGYACNAIVRIVNLKDRTKGLADAEIVIDGEQWPTWSDEQKNALIDHELEHLELATDAEGVVIRDDLDRPKLRMRKHDFQVGWFHSVARRHGEHSFEVQQYEAFEDVRKQRWIPGMEPEGNGKFDVIVDGRKKVRVDATEFVGMIEKKMGGRRKAASGK